MFQNFDLIHVLKPSGQRMRGSSSSPARLEGSEESLTLVTEAKARELLMLGNGGLATQNSKAERHRAGRPVRSVAAAGQHLAPTTRSTPQNARSATERRSSSCVH